MNDIGTAFSAPFKDPDWSTKFLIGCLVVLFCITGLGIFVLVGYSIETTQRVMRREQYILPEWKDLGVKFIVGFKYMVVLVLYALPIILLLFPLIALAALVAGSGEEGPLFVAMSVYFFAYFILVVPYSLLLTLLTPVIAYRFAERERIADALDVTAVFRAFKSHWESTTVVALLGIGIQVLAGFGIFALIIGVLFTVFYAVVVVGALHGLLCLDHQLVLEGEVV